MALHSELEDGCAVVLAHLCLLSVKPHPHTQVLPTPTTPHVERELKPIKKSRYINIINIKTVGCGLESHQTILK